VAKEIVKHMTRVFTSVFAHAGHGLPSAGIPYVIANGRMVVKHSKFQKGV